ncbi:hypothetical protein HETIRDRAFT_305576 [Heterobasidion irregulare TC 32-1]|uniref:Roadblock/LAMTOR2 domain-containing protein n=1 Tax=Heterobasidion irregulare (strain TC 32-1) TaxID=747525 RepID=W4KM81_HETIT|nr:uncharacterized protein HETIRDRAFT_305576 [Heterobasidion irregulare TC 32-1]ETW86794.1 hypothetical protein HETIRDRAFT_305576 [Heterobasidion irregulare TC 32-1]
MLVLSNVHKLLARALAPPELHTAVLLTPAGQLVSCAADPARCKDDVRAIVGLSGEKWQEAGDRGVGMESPFGRIMVLAGVGAGEVASEKPLMLVALNATSAVEWDVLEAKAKLAGHLARPIGKIRAPLAAAMAVPAAPATTPSRLPR